MFLLCLSINTPAHYEKQSNEFNVSSGPTYTPFEVALPSAF